MTKEQWLKNRLSDKPDYAGLLDELTKTKDKDLLEYLTNGIGARSTVDELWNFILFTSFVQNILESEVTDFTLSDSDTELMSKLK